ncbi:MAG: DUF4342 domain-containing protein [Chloroflexota bacterium]
MTEDNNTKTFTEQVEVAGNQLVDKVKELVAEGNVRRIILRAPDDKVMMEMTLTTSAVVGGAITLAAPWLAALGAVAALVSRMRIEIVREVVIEDPVTADDAEVIPDESKPSSTGPQKVKIQIDD